MNILQNLDLLSVGVLVAGIVTLGFVLYFSNRFSVTNRTFLYLSFSIVVWSIFNYLVYQVQSATTELWILRLVMFSAIWFAFFLYRLAYVFPDNNIKVSVFYKWLAIPAVVVISLLTLTPFVFQYVTSFSVETHIISVSNGPAIFLFALGAIGFLGTSTLTFLKKYFGKKDEERRQFQLVITGFIITFFLLIIFNFILPAFYINPSFIKFGALFIFPFVAFTFYAIYKHHLFRVKVAAVAFVAFILTIFSFFNIIYAADASQVVINITFFAAILVGSIILIRTILHDIEQREKIESLNAELGKANENQVELIHFITHQVKGFFTKSRDVFSMLLEGDEGAIPEAAKDFIRKGLESDTKGVAMVQQVLNAANIKSGIVKYDMKVFDLRADIMALVSEYKVVAEEKGLVFNFKVEEGAGGVGAGGGVHGGANGSVATRGVGASPVGFSDYNVTGDEGELKQVFKNLIENSVKYTQKGTVWLTLGHTVGASKILFSVKDTGVGISPEDKVRLFTQGGRGRNSVSINVESTGYGLFIAKGIVEAHHGRIWAESEGTDKGSQFYVELPMSGKSVSLEK